MADQPDWLPEWFWDIKDSPAPPEPPAVDLRQQAKMLNFGSIYGGPTRIGTIKSFSIAGSPTGRLSTGVRALDWTVWPLRGADASAAPHPKKHPMPDFDEFSPMPSQPPAALFDPEAVKLAILKGRAPDPTMPVVQIDYSKLELMIMGLVPAEASYQGTFTNVSNTSVPQNTPPEGYEGHDSDS